jgi:signal recognition particle subunit SRP54
MEAIINSMTPAERRDPELISGSRKRRIAMGSGTQVQDIGRLIKQHKQMQKMMKKFSAKGGMAKMMRGMGGMLPGGGMPKMYSSEPAACSDPQGWDHQQTRLAGADRRFTTAL